MSDESAEPKAAKPAKAAPAAAQPKGEDVNPDQLIAHIRNNSITKGVILSIGVHIVVIVLTSLGTLATMAGISSPEDAEVTEATTDTATATANDKPADPSRVDRVLNETGGADKGNGTAAGGTGTGGGINQAAYDKIVNDTAEPETEPTTKNLEFTIDSLE